MTSERYRGGLSPLGLPVSVPGDAQPVGRITDVLIDPGSGSLRGLVVSAEGARWLVDAGAIERMSGDAVRIGGRDALEPLTAADATAPVDGYDSGEVETLADGAISIPLLEERAVVTKQLFVRERIIVRKDVETRTETVRDELRRERAEVERE